jgi:ferredoxin
MEYYERMLIIQGDRPVRRKAEASRDVAVTITDLLEGGEEELMAYRITEDCLACGACVDECPNGAISEGDTIYVIDPGLCDDCGTCADICPSDAIVAG